MNALKKLAALRKQVLALVRTIDELELELKTLTTNEQPYPKRKEGAMVTLKEFSEIAGVHYNTIRRWVKEGSLQPHQLGTKQYFLRSELPDLLKKVA